MIRGRAEIDPLRDEGRDYAVRLSAAVVTTEWTGRTTMAAAVPAPRDRMAARDSGGTARQPTASQWS
ncbi:hypothetical protein ACFUCQ_11010 [Streptomyces sp. NPDC057197]|uniref:hypothetical protein n=1 Tax=Streptomyces sp. NPDC057197 TaxID=3346045 RepID=UPI003630FF50